MRARRINEPLATPLRALSQAIITATTQYTQALSSTFIAVNQAAVCPSSRCITVASRDETTHQIDFNLSKNAPQHLSIRQPDRNDPCLLT